MKFSERIGKNPPRKTLQHDDVDQPTRNRLWNVVRTHLPRHEYGDWDGDKTLRFVIELVYDRVFKAPISEIASGPESELKKLEKWFTKQAEWFTVYDFLELVTNADAYLSYPEYGFPDGCTEFRKAVDSVLSEELAGVRFVGRQLAPVTSEEEIESIEGAIGSPVTAVSEHLREALAVLSDRKLTDYRNSVKESISAVEAAARAVTNQPKATLSDALKVIRAKHGLHAALEQALSKLYAYTSDANGIRHAFTGDASPVDRDLAKFMLVTCSAFCGLLLSGA
jgi:hypothetical protein